MGEEVQKPAEDKKPEEAKKPAAEEKKDEPKPDEKPTADQKKPDESKEAPPPPPPPQPQEIVLRVFMHCEGCARKVRRCLKGFEGVEDVLTDCKTQKVVVKGEKADPLKVLERVQKKSHRQVELLSPIPKPPAADEPKKAEEKPAPKPEEKIKEEPQVITVVLKVHMHCEACAQEIRKRILRMKGVESAEPDLKSSQVTVKGAFQAPQLVEYVYKRTSKHAVVVKQDPPDKKKEEGDKGKDGKDEKKGGEGGGEGEKKEEKKADGAGGDGGEAKGKEVGEPPAAAAAVKAEDAAGEESVEGKVVELRKNEFYYYSQNSNYQIYPPRYATESGYTSYPPAPQMFSDENPNACSVM